MLLLVFKKCLNHGMDVNSVGSRGLKRGDKPIHTALHYRRLEVFKLLLAQPDIQVNDYNKCGETLLTMITKDMFIINTMFKTCIFVKMFKLLLARQDIDLDKANKNGQTPLYFASSLGHSKLAQWLLDAGANPNRANQEDETPLLQASRNGHTKNIQMLLDAGADVNKVSRVAWTPLVAACVYGLGAEAVQLLLSAGADPNKPTVYGETPLYRAIVHKFGEEKKATVEIVFLLLRAGADPNQGTIWADTPIDRALQCRRTDIVEILVPHIETLTDSYIEGYQGHLHIPSELRRNISSFLTG